jgi:nitroreductase
MSGIVFFRTQKLGDLKDFYLNQVGCQLWQDQKDCLIFKKGNFLFGFCERDDVDREGIITFFYDRKEEVDQLYEKFKKIAISPPSMNEKYRIYQFFACDPEERMVEFQYFDHPVNRYLCGDELLKTRRSIRYFNQKDIPEKTLKQILDVSRFSPTSRNSQSYYFKIIREKELIKKLSEVRGESSNPIGRAPVAAAVCSDPDLSKRYIQDGCIAAYHFMLSAWFFGLGTCWIGGMDREEVKKLLKVPSNHYIATITPLGYPAEIPLNIPERKELSWFMR